MAVRKKLKHPVAALEDEAYTAIVFAAVVAADEVAGELQAVPTSFEGESHSFGAIRITDSAGSLHEDMLTVGPSRFDHLRLVSQEKRFEQALQRAEAWFREHLSQSVDAPSITDIEGQAIRHVVQLAMKEANRRSHSRKGFRKLPKNFIALATAFASDAGFAWSSPPQGEYKKFWGDLTSPRRRPQLADVDYNTVRSAIKKLVEDGELK